MSYQKPYVMFNQVNRVILSCLTNGEHFRLVDSRVVHMRVTGIPHHVDVSPCVVFRSDGPIIDFIDRDTQVVKLTPHDQNPQAFKDA